MKKSVFKRLVMVNKILNPLYLHKEMDKNIHIMVKDKANAQVLKILYQKKFWITANHLSALK